MRRLTAILCFFAGLQLHAQAPSPKLQQGIFEPVTATIPAMDSGRFIDITKAWANSFTRREEGYDASNVTTGSINISATKRNAFRYQNTGEPVDNKIRYTLQITFTQTSYTLKFVVNDIYGDGNNLLDYKLPDYYNSNGTLKDGYQGLEQSLQRTVNDIVASYHD
ncbi:MAG: hypothetical protein EOO00_01015 [Chitinophagaceae bacterium]|nr:MAG: hypothetical protein EOO00_01015 [Chitinophagaceae bacterium]